MEKGSIKLITFEDDRYSLNMNPIINLFFLIFLLSILNSCTNKKDGSQKQDYILAERNLIPEGVAFDNRTGTIYVGSTFKRKIVQITQDGKITDFIPEKYNDITSIVGMEVDEKRGILWANIAHANEVMPLKDPHPTADWITGICSFNIESRKLIRRYDLQAEQAFLNDLTVLPTGDVVITESVNNKIYRINSKTESLELFLEPQGFTFLNGITYSDKFNALYVSSVQGILHIDIASGNYYLMKTADSVDAGGIDGLAIYENKLIGHQSSKVSAFYLNDTGTEVIKAEILDSGKEFDSSTTGEMGGSDYYFIVNSQVRSGIDKEKRTIKPADSLKEIIIRKITL